MSYSAPTHEAIVTCVTFAIKPSKECISFFSDGIFEAVASAVPLLETIIFKVTDYSIIELGHIFIIIPSETIPNIVLLIRPSMVFETNLPHNCLLLYSIFPSGL